MFKDTTVKLRYQIPQIQIPRIAGAILQIKGVHKVFIDPISRENIVLQTIDGDDTNTIISEVNKLLDDLLSQSLNILSDNIDNSNALSLSSCCQYHNEKNVAEQLIDEKWVELLHGSDIVFSKKMNNLLIYLDNSFVEHIKNSFFVTNEIYTSPMFSEYYAEKLNLLKSHPEIYFIASHFNKDGSVSNAKKVFQTAPCFKTYFLLENTEIKKETIFLIKGLCFRNEIRNLYFLERMNCFTQREFVFFGDKDFILQTRDKICQETIKWMENVGISGKCQLANDPFFINQETKSKFEIPQEIKYEFQADIPYKYDTISIASFDTHGDFFAKNLNIRFKNKYCWSACIGLGIERVAWAFLQQHGLAFKKWPIHIRLAIEK